MKSKEKGLLAAVIVLIIVIGIWLAAGKLGDSETADETTENTTISLNEADSSSITAITYEKDGQTLSFIKDDETWLWEEDHAFPLSQSSLTSMAETLATVTASRELEDAGELSEYGLDAPALTVSYTDSDGNSKTFIVGDTNSAAGGCYFQISGDESVYIVDDAFADAFETDVYTMADMESFPTIAVADITGLKIESEEETLQLVSSTEDSTGWHVTENGEETERCSDSSITSLMNTIAGCSFQSDVDYQCENPAEYGLDTPAATVTVDYTETVEVETEEAEETADTDEEETEETESEPETTTVNRKMVLYIGGQNEDGDYYVRLDGSDEVHTLSSDVAEKFMNCRAVDLYDSYIITGTLDTNSRIDVTIDDEVWSIEKRTVDVETSEAETESSSETTSDDEADETEVETTESWFIGDQEVQLVELAGVYSDLSGMTAEQILDTPEEPQGNTTLTVVLYAEDGTETTVVFSEYDSSFQLASVNGVGRKLVNKRDVEKLIEELEGILQ
jgi:hypothetical protein